MRMMNKMKSPGIAMASPSEPVPESAMAGIRGQGSPVSEIPAAYEGQCDHGARRVGRFRSADPILCCLFGVMLIAVLLFIGSHVDRWAKLWFDPAFDHWVWHEPLDNWYL
jgi:hypothetical protein